MTPHPHSSGFPRVLTSYTHYCLCGSLAYISYSYSQLSKTSHQVLCCSCVLLYTGKQSTQRKSSLRSRQLVTAGNSSHWPVGGQERAQWVKAPASKSDVLSLVPAAHMMEGENPLPKVTPTLYMCTVACGNLHSYRNTHKINKCSELS